MKLPAMPMIYDDDYYYYLPGCGKWEDSQVAIHEALWGAWHRDQETQRGGGRPQKSFFIELIIF